MTTAAQDGGKVVQGSNGPALDANGNPVTAAGDGKGAPPAAAPAAASKDPAPAPKAGEGAAAGGDPPKPDDKAGKGEPRELGDDETPKPGEKLTLTTDALNKRMDRATRARLREEFGTDDPKVIKEKLAEFETLRKAEDERKKQAMTDLERAQTEAREWKTKADNLETAMQELRDSQDVAQVSDALKGVAAEFIKPKFWKAASAELAEHLGEKYTAEQLDKMSDDDREKAVRGWFTDYVKENPELAKEAAATPPPKDDKAAAKNGSQNGSGKTVPLTNGTTNADKKDKSPPVITTGRFAGKTAAPGHPNSLTATEFAQWKRDNNYNF